MLRNLLLIGTGSFVGGICRHLCQQLITKYFPTAIPLGTLSVNVVGSFIIGILYGLAAKNNIISPQFKLLLATGFCGGYTTFSSFALENFTLLQNGEFFNTALYIVSSLVAGIGAVYLGITLIRWV